MLLRLHSAQTGVCLSVHMDETLQLQMWLEQALPL
jgi:hypothetical protein